MRTTTTHEGIELPVLGQGTWRMGEDPFERKREIAALQRGLDLGMTLIDTAEMYGSGGAELVVGEALSGRRDEAFLVTKVLPSNASYDGTLRAAERSLRRLKTDRIDLYLLHWQGAHPVEETLRAFHTLRDSGKIRSFGISNFDTLETRSCLALEHGGSIVANQVLYNLMRRGVEWSLLPLCAEHGVAVMAYSPLEQARLMHRHGLVDVAERHGVSPEQVAIAWTLRQPHVVSIPKAVDREHVERNRAAADVVLTEEDLVELDAAFPPPRGESPLEVI